MKLFFTLAFSMCMWMPAFAQTATEQVSKLIAVQRGFNKLIQEKGIKNAYLYVTDESSIVFRPGPVSSKAYYKQQPDSEGTLELSPKYARIAKSNDWGFTSGPYVFKPSADSEAEFYGTYVTIWKKNRRNAWRMAMDAGIPHKKPIRQLKESFISPVSTKYLHQRSESRLKQREDIVMSSDILMSTIMKADNRVAQNEFLTDDSWLIFPDNEPIVGKKEIMAFWKNNSLKAITKPEKVDRSLSGEIAYTYGTASILAKQYNYVRIWEVQPGYKWSVILELFTVAEQ